MLRPALGVARLLDAWFGQKILQATMIYYLTDIPYVKVINNRLLAIDLVSFFDQSRAAAAKLSSVYKTNNLVSKPGIYFWSNVCLYLYLTAERFRV